MPGEEQQEKGKVGVYEARRWLDSTTRVRTLWDVYDQPALCTKQRLSGGPKGFDVTGLLIGADSANGPLFYGEVKNHDTEGGQGPKYVEYLASCYSVAAKMLEDGPDQQWEFMWVTWHPFSVTKWAALCSAAEVKAAAEAHKATLLAGQDVSDEVAALVAKRLWLIVLSRRQEELTMSEEYLGEIRKQATLATKP